jgi:hypothetical protein
MGYADAAGYLSNYDETGIPFTPSATRMKDPAPGIAFREKMEGWFSLGTTDPDEGALKGKEENISLSLNAAIYIHDLRNFLKNSTRSGMMAGHINFEPFDDYLPAKTGVFNLFVEHENHGPDTKWMIYEMEFEHKEKSYYLAGKKEVRDDPGFDLWDDTTTLRVQLHEGTDRSGPVVGAGVLKLSKTELLKLLRSMHAIAAESSAERFNLIANFGAFFIGELWDSYKAFALHEGGSKTWVRYLKIIALILGLAGTGWLIYILFFS